MKSGVVLIESHVFRTLLAISPSEQEKGLMFVDPPTPIMTFVYNSPSINKFWMKSTPAPLDIVFCCKNKVTQLCVGEPESTKLIGDDSPSDLVIEFPIGYVNKFNIKIGDYVELV